MRRKNKVASVEGWYVLKGDRFGVTRSPERDGEVRVQWRGADHGWTEFTTERVEDLRRVNYYGDAFPGPYSQVFYRDALGIFAFSGPEAVERRAEVLRSYGISQAYVDQERAAGRGGLVELPVAYVHAAAIGCPCARGGRVVRDGMCPQCEQEEKSSVA